MLSAETVARIRSLAAGRMPTGVDPDSPDGRECAAIIEWARTAVQRADPMDEPTRHRVWRMLQGGAG